MNYSRRDFIRKSAITGASVVAAASLSGIEPLIAGGTRSAASAQATGPFKLKYAPSIGMFKTLAGSDPVDQIKFCHDQGFRAMFDNGIMGRAAAEQDKIVKAMQQYGMEFGPYVLYADFSVKSFVLPNKDVKDLLTAKMKEGVECTKRTGIKHALVVPGRIDERAFDGYQLANVIDNLRFCCDIVESAGIVMVLEPLNRRDHPGLYLTDMPQAYSICRAVNRPSCKIVDDIYHQQISEGNIIPNIESSWSEIGAFHLGDNPGRNEPTSGEINYKNVFKYIHSKGFDGVLCMEHGRSQQGKEGEQRVIDAYRECDAF